MTVAESISSDVDSLSQSSPYPPIMDSSHYKPVPEFVSVDWTGPTLAKKVAIRDGNTGETRTFSDYNTYM